MKLISKRRRGALAAVAMTVAATIAVGSSPPVQAADGPYTIDGTVPDVDPAPTELNDPFGNIKELGPENGSHTKIGVIHNAEVPMLSETNPNAQVDLRRAWLDTAQDQFGDDWLYFAWERDKNTGSGFIAYEFMKEPAPDGCDYDNATNDELEAACNPWANRTAGDFLILWDQQGNSLDLFLRVWQGTAPNLTLSPEMLLDTSVSQAAYSPNGFRGEAAVNLTATIFGGSQACLSFANTIPSTVTGNSDTADYKDTILQTAPPITNCTSTTVTTPKVVDGGSQDIPMGGVSIGSGVVEVRDSAVVDIAGGSSAPAGSVDFYLCKVDAPNLCGSGGTSVGTSALTGANYPATVESPSAYVTSVGRYCWRAEFSGDGANGIPGSSDSSATECFVVNPVTPGLETTAGSDVTVGSPVTDTATLSGLATDPATPVINVTGTAGPDADGTITFQLFEQDSGCGSLVHTSSAVSVSGNGTYNTPDPQFIPTTAGDYSWVATYSGSANNNGTTHNDQCDDVDEDVTVNPSTTTTVTTPQANGGAVSGPLDVNSTVFDLAVVTSDTAGAGEPDGTVTFYVCDPAEVVTAGGTCASGGAQIGAPVALVSDGAGTGSSRAMSEAITADEVGTWCFRAVYSGSTNFDGSADSSAGECFLVTDTTSIASQQDWVPNDTAQVTSAGGTALTGDLTFELYPDGDCGVTSGEDPTYTASFELNGAASGESYNTSNTTPVTETSTVSWLVTFTSDDGTNVGSSSHCEVSMLTIDNDPS